MKIYLPVLTFCFLGSIAVHGQPFIGSFYAPDGGDGMVITLKEENGLYSGTLRGEGEVYQVQCQLEDGVLNGQVLGKPIAVNMVQKGFRLELTLADVKWGALVDDSTARTYILTMQGEKTSAAANYVQSGEGGEEVVVFNGQVLSRRQLEDFNKRYHRYPRPGNYWYDPMSGLYGVVGFDAFGYMYPGHSFGPLPEHVSRGNSGFYVNGRCLSKKEVKIWNRLMGKTLKPGRYWFDDSGNFGREGKRDYMYNLYTLGKQYDTPAGQEDHFWATQFARHRKGGKERDGFVSVPGFGPEGYGFEGP